MRQDCAVFWFVCKAHPPVHIGGYVLVDATQQTDQRTSQMVDLFFPEAPRRGGFMPTSVTIMMKIDSKTSI